MDHLNKKTFLKLLILGPLTILALTAPLSVFALNLKEAKMPIHCECQTTLSGGLWQDEKTSEWMSGKVIPHPQKYQMVIERFDDTKGKRKKDCLQEERRTGGLKFKSTDFCLTFNLSGGEQSKQSCKKISEPVTVKEETNSPSPEIRKWSLEQIPQPHLMQTPTQFLIQ